VTGAGGSDGGGAGDREPAPAIAVVAYPGLAVHTLAATFPKALGELPTPPWLLDTLRAGAPAPLRTSDTIRAAVRDVLRAHGYRPTGRGKPSSEYLAAAIADGRLGSINAAVDAGNAVSLHSGLPISVVDRDALRGTVRIDVPAAGSAYVFNRSGQTIDVGGLVSLSDGDGPCANADKDAQRTKTSPATTRVVAVVWGADGAGKEHVAAAATWLREVLERLGASVDVLAQR
jgi:DNA/RNA-binding domain of Phe-tRNA-synthetase-like protein